MHLRAAAQPLALEYLRRGIAVHRGERTVVPPLQNIFEPRGRGSELPADEYRIARARRRAAFHVRQRAAAYRRHAYRYSVFRGRGVSADQCDVVFGREPAITRREVVRPLLADVGGQGDRQQRGSGLEAHRRHVAQIHGQ